MKKLLCTVLLTASLCIATAVAQNLGPPGGGGGSGTITGVTAGQGITGGGTTGNVTVGVNLTAITNSLASNVTFSTTTYVDGPSIAQGPVGTWWVSGTVTISTAAANGIPYCKLWDGTTVIASTGINNAAGARTSLSLSGYIANPAGNLRISCNENNSISETMEATTTGNGKDSTISAIRIQ